ncbi:zinc finger protein ZFP2-like [Acanthochromis polyacanthus]|uniref:zinc finger protein ZFP2-like n=1 Tax=Acanthochromis polyacanthus TaxID=80966 RepID=UPI000B8F59F1|nr:zinc finger protein ZFP2-like [Acanthochromis polyacanthus]
MSSVRYLRELISERLTAAAEEIFAEFEKTIVQYEEEIDRQRRLLDNIWKPEITLHTIGLSQQHVCKQEILADQERNYNVDQEDPELPQIEEEQEKLCTSLDQEDQEHPQIKEEQEELCTSQEGLCSSQEGEQLILKLEAETFLVTPTYDENYHSEPEPNSDQMLSHTSSIAESPDQEGSMHVGNSPMSGSHCHTDTGKKKVKCDVCGKAFKKNCEMKRHYRIHTGEKPYICSTCGKRFSEVSSFKYHKRIHTGEKPYSCEMCGKSFRSTDNLLVHMRTHTGEKPYSCQTCGKNFSRSGHLLGHMRTHTGEKRYSCEACGKRFSQSCNLLRHMRTHTGEKPYSCENCWKNFAQRGQLLRHLRTHTGEKPFPETPVENDLSMHQH